jgi:hypothetical protein
MQRLVLAFAISLSGCLPVWHRPDGTVPTYQELIACLDEADRSASRRRFEDQASVRDSVLDGCLQGYKLGFSGRQTANPNGGCYC